MKIPISRLGKLQKIDVEKSGRLHDDYGRICQVVQSPNWHGDLSPCRMAKFQNIDNFELFDKQFVVQVAGCPLKCPFCYVDNFKMDKFFTADELVTKFAEFRKQEPNLNVFHLCGGCPARYSEFWLNLRKSLDENGFWRVILLSDVIFVENHFYNVKPWETIRKMHPYNFFIVGCLKGTTKQNFIKNTGGFDLFETAVKEMKEYLFYPNFWISLIEWDVSGIPEILKIISHNRIDWLKVIKYEAVKKNEYT